MDDSTINLTEAEQRLCEDVTKAVGNVYPCLVSSKDFFSVAKALRSVLEGISSRAYARLMLELRDKPVEKCLLCLRVLAVGGGIDIPASIEIPGNKDEQYALKQIFAEMYDGLDQVALERAKKGLVKSLKKALEETEAVRMLKGLEQ